MFATILTIINNCYTYQAKRSTTCRMTDFTAAALLNVSPGFNAGLTWAIEREETSGELPSIGRLRTWLALSLNPFVL